MFRKAKALGEIGFYEKAYKILEQVKRINPAGLVVPSFILQPLTNMHQEGPTVDAEIARLRAIENERDRAHNQKLKGWPELQ